MSEVAYYDETTNIFPSEWTLEFREPEYGAFLILLGDLHSDRTSGIVRDILDARRSKAFQAWLVESLWHRKVYSKWRYYANRFRGLDRSAYAQKTAMDLGITAKQVWESIRFIEDHGIPEAA